MKTPKDILQQLSTVYANMRQAETDKKLLIDAVGTANRQSAINLVDYLSLRSTSLESLQEELHHHGLSSLASSESHIKSQVLKVMKVLGAENDDDGGVDDEKGAMLLQQNIHRLLGKTGKNDAPPIMVTFDTDFAKNTALIVELLRNGMRVARINCAHDGRDIWLEMINSVEKAKIQTGLPCKIYMDMAGPKIRTQIIRKNKKRNKLVVEAGQEVMLTENANRPGKEKFICCTLAGIIENLKPGHRVLIDDGLFEAVVQNMQHKEAILKITRVSAKKPEIKSEKGLNFPDTVFETTPITAYDLECLPFIVEHADMLGFSFVNSAADMQLLRRQLKLLKKPVFPVIAKIETAQAVKNLAEIILQGMHQDQFGVMVARGDLAIEIGFERMSEIQDEILWLCEAAHVPVIWATQVLESMNKSGIATRGEITDAVHAAAADCVMLNKGGHILEVLQTLVNILIRSRRNSLKNRRLFRKLSIAEHFFTDSD